MNKKWEVSCLSFFILLIVLSAGLQAQFAKTYGGKATDDSARILTTPDNGFVVLGSTTSFTWGGPWLVKLAAEGSVQWEKTYSFSDYRPFMSVCGSPDGGYVLAGGTSSFLWVMRTDGVGEAVWQKTVPNNALSGTNPCFICPAAGSGYFVVGSTNSGSDDDIWVIKLSADGDIVWQKAYGLGAQERGVCAVVGPDGALVVAGTQVGAGDGIDRLLVFELDALGAVSWQNSYSSTDLGLPGISSIGAAGDGGSLLAGAGFVLKLGHDGTPEWARSYPSVGCSGIRPTSDGGSIVVGTVPSNGSDMAVIKLGANGDIEWQKAFGGPFQETGSAVVQTTGGDFAIAGVTSSFGAGLQDLCVVRFSAGGGIGACRFSTASSVAAGTPGVSESPISLSLLDTSAAPQTENVPVTDTAGTSQSFRLCANQKLLTISTEPAEAGPGASPAAGSYVYLAGARVLVSAAPTVTLGGTTYDFSGWLGDTTAGTNSVTIEMTDDKSIRAQYVAEWGGDDDGHSIDEDWGSKGGKGCFIATAAYRTPLHPAVRLLRNFRDRRLLTNGIGRTFVAAYYRWSPPAARVIAGSTVLRLLARVALIPVIAFAAIVLKLGWLVSLLLMTAVMVLGFRKVLRWRWARAA